MKSPGIRSATTAAVFALCSVGAVAAEKTVTYDVEGEKVVGTLNLPDGIDNPPVIVLFHGFTGSRDELVIPAVEEGIFQRAARMWADKGIASLRIDFRHSGESGADYENTTVGGQVMDGLAALDYLAASGEVDPDRMAIVGWSMGGTVGASVAGRTDHDLDAVALWAPGANLASAILLLLGPDSFKEGLASEGDAVTSKLPWGADVTLKPAFFDSLFEIDPVAEITGYDGPLFVAVGSNDTIVFPQPESGQVFLDYHDGEEELFVRPMDHTFNAFTDEKTVDELINATGDYISAHFD